MFYDQSSKSVSISLIFYLIHYYINQLFILHVK